MNNEQILNFGRTNEIGDIDFNNNDINSDINQIHLRVQQRNGRKCITSIQGISEDINHKQLLKTFKRTFNCNGSISKHDEYGKVIQLSGDQRHEIKNFLVSNNIVNIDKIVLHGGN